jgi:hypothetical protein
MNPAVRASTRPAEVAAYIEQATAELRDLAMQSGFPFLGYLIDMARLEAAGLSLRPDRSDDRSGPTA